MTKFDRQSNPAGTTISGRSRSVNVLRRPIHFCDTWAEIQLFRRRIAMPETAIVYDHEGDQSLNFNVPLKDLQKQLPLRVLSLEDWRHWTTWGYVIVHNAVPAENVERLKATLWEFQE